MVILRQFKSMEKKKIHYMNAALQLAMENLEARNGGPFGCLIVRDGEIIATGYNEVIQNSDPTCHAEIVAIRKACQKLGTYQLTGCEIYSSCEPCPMCMGAIYWARAERLYFAASRQDAQEAGFDDKHIYEELNLSPDQRKIPGEQIMKAQGIEVLQRWRELDLDIKY